MADTFDFEEEEPKKQTGLMVVAGGLVVLLVVLNVGSGEDEKESPAASEYVPPGVAESDSRPPERRAQKIEWPESLFADVIRTNPFQMNQDLAEAVERVQSADDVSPDTKPEEDQSGTTEDSSVTNVVRLDEEKYPVRFVMTGPGGNAAMIRDRVYHVGDVIEGMQLVSISPTGVGLHPTEGFCDR